MNRRLNSRYLGGLPEKAQIELVNSGILAVDFVLNNSSMLPISAENWWTHLMNIMK